MLAEAVPPRGMLEVERGIHKQGKVGNGWCDLLGLGSLVKFVQEMDVESCTICTETLGSVDRPSVQLPCGHVFCAECVEGWQRLRHADCPSCRQEFPKGRVRTLCPWRNGLKLTEPTSVEQGALKALDEARVMRRAVEERARALEQTLRCMRRAASSTQTSVHCVINNNRPPNSVESGDRGLAQPAAGYCAQQPSGLAQAVVVTSLTEEQQQRASANRMAALERKRKREQASALAAATMGEPLAPSATIGL